VPHHQLKIVHQQFGAVCGNQNFQSILIHHKSDMVGKCSSHPVIPPTGAPGASNNQEMMDFIRQMVESMEVLRKQNEDLNTRLTMAEA
jgi:hypothetical protein